MAIQFPFQFDQRYQPGSIPQFGSFGPPNISNMLQSSISKLADPMIARLRELEVVNKAAALNRETSDIFRQPTGPTPPGAAVPASAAGVLGTPSAPFVNPSASTGAAGGSFAMGQGMDPSSSEPTPGGVGTVRPSSMLEAGKIGIAGVETGNRSEPYAAVGPDVKRADGRIDNAYGKYQVMGDNVGPWTEKYLGQRMTPQEFRASPEAQERVFEGEFGSYLDRYGNLRDAASKWFSGAPMKEAIARNANDKYTSVPSYISQMEQHIKRAYAGGGPPAPQQAPTASFAPPVAPAPTPAAAAAAQVHTDAATGRPIAANDPRINPDIQGRPIMPGGQRQVASLDPSAGTGSIRPPAPEVPVRRAPTQAFGPDGQPLPPAQQPAQPLPAGGPPNEQPDPPPPPPVQPPPPPVPPVQPPPPVQQAALPTPTAPAPQVAPSGVAPIAAAPVPPGQIAMGVPSPQAPQRMAQAAPQQAAPPQQRAAPIDQTADRFWEAVGRNAQTPEQALFANAKRLELRDPKVSYTVVDGVLVAHTPDGRATPVYGHQLKGPPTIKVKEGENERALQYDHKTDRWIPIGGGTPPGTIGKEAREFERNLFNDFEGTDSVKKYRELEQAVQGLKGAFTSGSATADLVATIQLFKAIDPNSTVTQNESASVKNAAGVPETLRALFNRGVGEGGQFSPELRAQIFNTAQRLQQGRVKQVEQHADAFRKRATAYGYDPDRSVNFKPFQFQKANPEDFPDERKRDPEPTAPRGSSRESAVDLSQSTPEAARRTLRTLPDGSWWVGADGVPRQKRGSP